MSREQALLLLEEFKRSVDATDCGAILLVTSTMGGLADVEISSNLKPEDQIRILQTFLQRLDGRLPS